MVHSMQMPYSIRRLIRKRDWRLYGETNKRLRKVQAARASIIADAWPVDAAYLDSEINRLTSRSATLREKLTQEV